uniref:dolichyl-phosphate-mannose--protein mannosyltransferase n=1 Tax=Callorhinchus milii TaxID=7868 RepID=A0A4W3GGR4_CALMI
MTLGAEGSAVRHCLCHGLCVALCAAAYWNGLPGDLVHDDVWAIVNNPDVRTHSPTTGAFSNDFWGKKLTDSSSHKSYRPLCILSFKLNVLLGGMTPLHFHVVNVLLHCAVTSLLLYTCDKAVFGDCHLAFLTALLFSVHPVHTEAVTGIVGRADVLACLFFLLAFLSYIRSVDSRRSGEYFAPTTSPIFLLFSLLLGTCAMLVKETGVTVFGVCVIYDLLILCPRRPLLPYHSPLPTSPCPYYSLPQNNHLPDEAQHLLLRPLPHPAAGHPTPPPLPAVGRNSQPAALFRFLTYSYLLVFNAWLLLAPITLCYDWQVGSIPLVESLWDARNVATAAFVLGILLLTFTCLLSAQRLEHREILVGLLFLALPFVPASNLFFRVGFVVAERVLYMPSMGYCILVVHGVKRLRAVLSKWGASIVMLSTLLLLGLFFWKTVRQNEVWLSRESLFRAGVQTLPLNAKVHYNYANFLKDQGRQSEAIYHYKTALKLYPRHPSALNNLGTLTRNVSEAEIHYRQALKLNPQHNRALFNLGNLYKSQRRWAEAEHLLRDSISYGPQFGDAFSSLAALLIEQGRLQEADVIYLRGIENCLENSDLHNNYGVFLVDKGDVDGATRHYLRAIGLNPKHHVAMVNLGRLLRSSDKNEEAESWYKRALQMTRDVDILSPLGALYYNTGRYEQALRVYSEAIGIQPSNTDLQLAMAQVLCAAGRVKDAERLITHIATEKINCLECYRLLSAIYNKQGNLEEALHAVQKALEMKPKDAKILAELHFSQGNNFRELNRLDMAFESYKRAVELNPQLSQGWMNMGGIKHIKGDYPAARGYYEKALQLVPGSKILQENLSKLDRLEKRGERSPQRPSAT